MIIDEVVLDNIGVYRGTHRIPLTPSSGRPVTVIGGLNGGGKTTLLDAIQLALYGKRARCSNRNGVAYQEFLRRTISHQARDTETAKVELVFRLNAEGYEQSFRVRRRIDATGRTVREELTVDRNGSFDPVVTDNWDDYVEDLLPLDVASLFFFDGEKLEALADPSRTGAVIGSAIYSLFGLHLVDQLRTDLVALERRKQAEELDETEQAEVDRLEAVVVALEASHEAAFLERGAARTTLRRAELRVERADAAFRLEGGTLYKQRKELDTERRAVTTAIGEAEDESRAIASGVLPLALARALLTRTADSADPTRGLDPARLVRLLEERDAALLALLNARGPGGDLVDAVMDHLVDDRSHRVRAAPLHDADVCDHARQVLSTLLPETTRAAEAVGKTLESLRVRLEHLDRQLGAVPSRDALIPVMTERDTAHEQLGEAEAALAAAQNDLDSCKRLRDEAAANLERALKAQSEIRLAKDDAARISDHANRVQATLAALRSRLVDRHVSTIEAAVLDSLHRLLRKETLIADLRLDRGSFSLTLYGDTGDELSAERLSAGERQLLAVAILWGLARVSGRKLPTIIDTPLGRLDREHRRRLVERYFPHAANQVILLSTDEEIDAELLSRLGPHVNTTYLLDIDDAAGTTRIEEGYFWPLEQNDVA